MKKHPKPVHQMTEAQFEPCSRSVTTKPWVQGTPAHAQARLWLRARQQGTRYPSAPADIAADSIEIGVIFQRAAIRRVSSLVNRLIAERRPGRGGTDIGFLLFLIERLMQKG